LNVRTGAFNGNRRVEINRKPPLGKSRIAAFAGVTA